MTAVTCSNVPSSTFIGALSAGIGIANAHYFNGYIDDVRLYNRALSAQAIKQTYVDTFALYRPLSFNFNSGSTGRLSRLPLLGAG